ncbi:MAG: DNA polymerase III subunit delta [Clostridiales bacterium]|jgi:DNA polymerase-3 subunit delta|nr:DNA polymerase III subunit delta [Clostridiales bacterium]
MALTVTQFNKQLKEGVKNLYLFYGEERFLYTSYIEKIKERVLSDGMAELNYTVFDGKSAVFGDFVTAVNTYPQMAAQKLLVMKHTEFLTLAEYQKSAAELLAAVPEYAVLIFVEEDAKKIKKDLLKLLETRGTAVEFAKQSAADLRAWVNRTFAAEGKRMKVEDMEHLVTICGRSLDTLKTECAKLSAAADGEVITRTLIDTLVQVPLEFKIYAMSDKLLAGDAGAAYLMLREFKINKEQPTVMISLIYSQLASLYMFRRLGRDAEDFLPPGRRFLAKRYAAECTRHDEASLRAVMRQCAEADTRIKSGKTDGWTALELIMANVIRIGRGGNVPLAR